MAEGIIVSPYDAELFGHWWFEGPEWLKEVLRLASQEGEPVGLTTFSSYLAQYPPEQEVSLGPSSWGEGGFNRVWLNESNDWTYPWLHQAERAMINLARRDFKEGSLDHRACCQAVRELLLAQSSDWPFILTNRRWWSTPSPALRTTWAAFLTSIGV